MLAAALGGCGSRGRDLLRQKSKSRGPGDAPLQPMPGVCFARTRGILPSTHLAREGRMTVTIGRRELLVALGGAAAWPLAARAQQPAMPVVGFLRSTPATGFAYIVDPFRQGL